MKLDSELQRTQLLEVINALPIQGNLSQVTQMANSLLTLGRAIESAGLEPKKEEEPK